jgi:hypothetical protein
MIFLRRGGLGAAPLLKAENPLQKNMASLENTM